MSITLGELLNKALLSIPDTEESYTLEELNQGSRFRDAGGIYTFYNRYQEPLYVGISNKVGKRVVEHLGSPKGNRDIVQYVKAGNDIYVEVFYEDSKAYQELYESYLIHQWQPRFNVSKTGRKKI